MTEPSSFKLFVNYTVTASSLLRATVAEWGGGRSAQFDPAIFVSTLSPRYLNFCKKRKKLCSETLKNINANKYLFKFIIFIKRRITHAECEFVFWMRTDNILKDPRFKLYSFSLQNIFILAAKKAKQDSYLNHTVRWYLHNLNPLVHTIFLYISTCDLKRYGFVIKNDVTEVPNRFYDTVYLDCKRVCICRQKSPTKLFRTQQCIHTRCTCS